MEAANSVTDALKGLDSAASSMHPSPLSADSGLVKDLMSSATAATSTEGSVASKSPAISDEAFDRPRVEDVVGILDRASAGQMAGQGHQKYAGDTARAKGTESAQHLSSSSAADAATASFERDLRWTDPFAGLPKTSSGHQPKALPSSESIPTSAPSATPSNEAQIR